MSVSRDHLRGLRYLIQFAFLALTVLIGIQFHHFVQHFLDPSLPYVQRPPSVDAFLPIGGFMALKYFLFTGIVDPIHPAGFVLFVTIVGVSLLMKKGFCGWICPIGTISQYVWMAGEKVLGRNRRIERHADIGLRSAKYMLMALFILLIGVAMVPNMMVLFFISDYYKTADVKTMQVFTEMSRLTFWVLLALAGLSILYKNFWCRYLCPYGALLGLVSIVSPVKVRRNDDACVHCGSCSRHCPSLLDVEKMEQVNSPECFGCLTCVSRCPSPGALDVTVGLRGGRRPFRPFIYPLALVLLFYGGIGAGMLTDTWQTKVPYEDYRRIIPTLYQQPVASPKGPTAQPGSPGVSSLTHGPAIPEPAAGSREALPRS